MANQLRDAITLKNQNATAGLTAISRKSAKEIVVDRIRQAILQGDLRPGERVTEISLAKALAVGQATVREALIELEHMGFIQRRKPRKTFIAKLTGEEIRHLYAVRIPLEGVAIELLVALSAPALEAADRAARKMVTAAKQQDAIEIKAQDMECHRALWAATGNPFLADILEQLVGKIFACSYSIIRQRKVDWPRMQEVAEIHISMLDRIRARDAAGAKALLEASMDKAWIEAVPWIEPAASESEVLLEGAADLVS